MSLQTRVEALAQRVSTEFKSFRAYVQGKGQDLIVNGFGTMGSNYNFSQFTFDPTDAPTGAAGAFITAKGIASVATQDEFLPVDPTKTMRFAYQIKQKGDSAVGYYYATLTPFDAYKILIEPKHYMFIPGTTTTLAAPLNPGDTTVTLTSAANWYGTAAKPAAANTHWRSIIAWDYTDPGGKLWPQETYSRNHLGFDMWADGGISGNVITLRTPYAGPAKPAGTKVSNGSSGGSYLYAVTNVQPAMTWTQVSATIRGVVDGSGGPGGMNASLATGWPPGVGYTKVGWLLNRTLAGGTEPSSRMSLAAVSFSDATAAGEAVDAWADPTTRTKISINALPAADPNMSSAVHLLRSNDPRLANARTPTGAAGGHLGGTYPNPTVAKVGYLDTRAVATTPNDYNATAVWNFKTTLALGLPGGTGTAYAFVHGFRAYTDSSGGEAREYAYLGANGGHVYRRVGATTTWGAWVKVEDGTKSPVFDGDPRLSNTDNIPRVTRRGNAASVEYYALATLPIDNTSNSSSLIITGRMGGWTNTNQAYWEVMLTNRSDYTGNNIGASVVGFGAHSQAQGITDLVVYKQANLSAIVYLKVTSFYTFDVSYQTFESAGAYTGIAVVPTGTQIWSMAAAEKFTVDQAGVAAAGGQNLVKANDARLSDPRTPTAHTHTKSQITDFAHTHAIGDLPATVFSTTHLPDWSEVAAKPATFPPATHTHVATTDLTATGTKDATTFLRGDNTWAAVPAAATANAAQVTSGGNQGPLSYGAWSGFSIGTGATRGSGITVNSNHFVVVNAGWYQISLMAAFTVGTGRRILAFERFTTQPDGSGDMLARSDIGNASYASDNHWQSLSGMSYFFPGDKVRPLFFITGSGTVYLNSVRFTIHEIL